MPSVDFIVIGSGAAGGVVAKELAEGGFQVVILEQGPHLKEKDFTHDELHYVRHQGLTNDQKVQPVTFRRNDSETAQPWKAIAYGRQVGGGTVHFAANYWRFHESDFNERSTFGDVPGSSFADWPLTYADLEPFYAKAERDIGVSGLAGANPFEAPRSGPYPLPPMPVKSSGVLFDRGATKLGLHPFPAPVAILSQPYQGRGACTHCGWCQWFGCEMRAKSSTLATVIPQAIKTGRCELRANAYVRRIQTDKGGRVTGVVYFDARRKEVFLKAKGVVLCANGVESPRLLLLSKSNRFPHGLANSSGLVGRNLMWDNSHGVQALFEHPLHDYKSIRVTRVLHDFYKADARRGFYGGGAMDARFGSFPAAFALGGLPAGTPRWGAEYKKALAEYFPRTMMVVGHSTSLPVDSNRVDLDPQAKDAWGLPAVRVTFDFHPDDQKTARWLWQKQIEILEAAGARRIWGEYNEKPGLSAHLMGTCRMGVDRQRSVVNAWSRAHDVPNLWIVDGSNFVTSARQQPTATIQALAYRAAAGIIIGQKRGEV